MTPLPYNSPILRAAEFVTSNIVDTLREEGPSLLDSWPTKRAAILAHKAEAREAFALHGGTGWTPAIWKRVVAEVTESLCYVDWPTRSRRRR